MTQRLAYIRLQKEWSELCTKLGLGPLTDTTKGPAMSAREHDIAWRRVQEIERRFPEVAGVKGEVTYEDLREEWVRGEVARFAREDGLTPQQAVDIIPQVRELFDATMHRWAAVVTATEMKELAGTQEIAVDYRGAGAVLMRHAKILEEKK